MAKHSKKENKVKKENKKRPRGRPPIVGAALPLPTAQSKGQTQLTYQQQYQQQYQLKKKILMQKQQNKSSSITNSALSSQSLSSLDASVNKDSAWVAPSIYMPLTASVKQQQSSSSCFSSSSNLSALLGAVGATGNSDGVNKNLHDDSIVATAATAMTGLPVDRVTKPNASDVTLRILTILMSEEPMSIVNLHRYMIDIPKETIQSCIDVLQIVEVVIPVKEMLVQYSNSNGSALTTSNSTVTSEANGACGTVEGKEVLYTMAGFAKGTDSFDIRQIKHVVELKRKRSAETTGRINELTQLSLMEGISNEDRKKLMKNKLESYAALYPETLQHDALYQSIIEKCY